MQQNTRRTTVDGVLDAAARLSTAGRQGRPCPSVAELIGPDDLDAGYAVQSLLLGERRDAGARVVGRTLRTGPALSSGPTSRQPAGHVFGTLLDDMVYADTDALATGAFFAPHLTVAVAFVLGDDLSGPATGVIDVLRATAFLLPAVEITDSRIEQTGTGPATPALPELAADNGGAAAVVLGTTPYGLTDRDLGALSVSLEREGVPLASGPCATALGSPVRAVTWLARECARLGRPLAAGEIVLSGALTPPVAFDVPGRHRAELAGLGHTEVRLVS